MVEVQDLRMQTQHHFCADHFIVNKSPALGKGARPVVAGKTGISGREAMWEFSSSLIP